MKRFGCTVHNPIKLTRENYAQLTDSNRIKTQVAKQVGLLGQTCDEIINDYLQLSSVDTIF